MTRRAVRMRGGGVLLGDFLTFVLAMVSRLATVMGGRLVLGRRFVVMFGLSVRIASYRPQSPCHPHPAPEANT